MDCAHAAVTIAAELILNRRPELPNSAAFYRGVCAGLLMAVEGITAAEASDRSVRLLQTALKRAGHGEG